MFNKTIEKKYPKSKAGHQCLTPCYEPNTWIIHPQSLEYLSDKEKPFCSISITDKGETIDECYVPTKTEDFSRKDIEMNILVPKIDFNCNHFLKIYYNITSSGSAINWISTHQEASIYTKLRIMECTLKEYGKTIEIMNNNLLDFYTEVIKKVWIYSLYNKISSYIIIENNKIYLGKESELEDKNDKHIDRNQKITKVNFIIEKFANKNMVYKFLEKYFNKYFESWNDIPLHNPKMQEEYSNFVLEKIKATINNK